MKRNLLYLLIGCMALSCGDQKIDTARAKAEMEAREIKKVSEAEIIEEAMRLGKKISKSFQVEEELIGGSKILSRAFEQVDEYEINHYFLNRENDLSGKALGLFQAYKYNAKNGLDSEPIVQKLEDGTTFLYTKPSLLNGKTVGIWTIAFSRKDLVLSIKK